MTNAVRKQRVGHAIRDDETGAAKARCCAAMPCTSVVQTTGILSESRAAARGASYLRRNRGHSWRLTLNLV
jgi:hypothetical protein